MNAYTHTPGRMRHAACAAAALLLAGCTSLAPPYEAPALPVPAHYAGVAEAGNAQAADMAWRDYFTDPALQAVIEQALANNRDLRRATLRVAEARAAYGIQRAEELPSVGASAGLMRIGLPDNLTSLASSLPATLTSYSAFAGISSWELDLWGRVRNLSEAALHQYFAAEWTQRGAAVSLVAQTANAWLALRETDERLALARQALDNRAESLRIFSRRMEVGATSRLDLTQVRMLHQQARSLVAQLEQQRATQQHALDLIVGAPTPVAAGARLPATDALRPLPAGLPSDLLTRRPDIQAAEQQLRAAHAQIGVARAAFLPSISLTAMAGSASGELSDLFGSGTGAWLFRPAISVPLFTAGKLQNNLNLAEVRRDAAVVQYEQAIQGAFRDVSDALATQAGLTQQVQVLDDMLATQVERARLSRLRYDNGAARFLEVLDAERDLLATAQQLTQTRRALLSSRVALYAALGGGADPSPVSMNPSATP
ncbi:efflux transporter outer membrane subunit [Alicycliphilus denitrificans]|uniref:RND efflux system, outer membrane lipoprotein, NodT family n=2 Tax=Alicycliphilus denitrificans TaxID=179636 RepID=F4G8J6_ALIDK|nr:efflux transporter outer membrane subunit [Alicycliphilus denitrificans]AEB86721.1 RND efflux system, outer membrane lipoprotein, NodT family [Alicycliphilus denitrificans K601]